MSTNARNDLGLTLSGIATLDITVARQVLRWLGHDYQTANDAIIEALREALRRPDWEVRMTAGRSAARLRVREGGREVRHMELPGTRRSGLDVDDRSILRALQR